MAIHELMDDPTTLLALEPEELGVYIVEYLNSNPDPSGEYLQSSQPMLGRNPASYPPELREKVICAMNEAWHWVEREGLILARPYSGRFYVTRRGQRLRSAADIRAYTAARSLPQSLLHPRLVERVWGAVIRGDYETAVLMAFREVEIAVRAAAGLPDSDLGVVLMRRAFDRSSGPLTRDDEPEAEKEGLSHLFAGAIARFKNPSSHRSRDYTLAEVAEAVTLASMLLRIVDERSRDARATG